MTIVLVCLESFDNKLNFIEVGVNSFTSFSNDKRDRVKQFLGDFGVVNQILLLEHVDEVMESDNNIVDLGGSDFVVLNGQDEL